MRVLDTAKRVSFSGVLIAAALVLSYMERLLPMPVPGLKLGLGNIVTLFALYRLGVRETLLITVARCTLAALLFGGVSSLVFSLAGGILALLCMTAARRLPDVSIYGVSVLGASAHHVGQVLAAVWVTETPGILSYLLFLLPASLPTGLLIAFLTTLVQRRLENYEKN